MKQSRTTTYSFLVLRTAPHSPHTHPKEKKTPNKQPPDPLKLERWSVTSGTELEVGVFTA